MDTAVLGLHSVTRWLIVAALAWALYRGVRGWRRADDVSDRDRRHVHWCIGLTNVQLLLGGALYLFFSPWLAAVRLDPAGSMKNEIVRFFGIEHPLTMFVALVVLHVTAARFDRADDGRVAWRRLTVGFGIATVLILASIPWPFWWFGRPLLPFSG